MTPSERAAITALEPLSDRERGLLNLFCYELAKYRPRRTAKDPNSLAAQAARAGVNHSTYCRRLRQGKDPVTGKARDSA